MPRTPSKPKSRKPNSAAKTDDDTVLTPEEAKMVRRGEAQIRRGQYKLWGDVKRSLKLK